MNSDKDKHRRKYRRTLIQLAHGELAGRKLAEMELHLGTCAECSGELERLRSLISGLEAVRPGVLVTDELLSEARAELRIALRHERNTPTYWTRIADAVSRVLAPPARIAFGGIAMLVVGFIAGYVVFVNREAGSSHGEKSSSADRSRITNLRFTEQQDGSGDVDITFDDLTPMHMRGKIADPGIQKVLTYALQNEDNPGIRLRVVSAFSQQGNSVRDLEVKAALILALRSDRNAGVRRQALLALRRYPYDDQIKDALLNTLMTDRNPGLRVAAINALDTAVTPSVRNDQNLLNALEERSTQDNNNYVRLKAKAVLQEVRQQ